jgi:hypothetical protein
MTTEQQTNVIERYVPEAMLNGEAGVDEFLLFGGLLLIAGTADFPDFSKEWSKRTGWGRFILVVDTACWTAVASFAILLSIPLLIVYALSCIPWYIGLKIKQMTPPVYK